MQTASLVSVGLLLLSNPLLAAAPDWLRAQKDVSLPSYDAKTDAVLLYSDTVLTVSPSGTLKQRQRQAYKILRPAGERFGIVDAHFDSQSKILSMRAWSIPASGKEYEVKEKDAVETTLLGNSDLLVTDMRTKRMRIPAASVGNIVGFEIEQELRPYMHADEWDFQETVPVREATYTLNLPAGWSHKSTWINHPGVTPTATATSWQWRVTDLKAIRLESSMPPWQRIASRMFVTFSPPNTQDAGMQSWSDIAKWYANLARDRQDITPELKKLVTDLTASQPTMLMKIRALTNFVQTDIRYVAIEIGIGGWQPHHASHVFRNRFGDCKDKATLLGVMLREIGVESYHVIINTERGAIDAKSPAHLAFNHMILAVKLPTQMEDPTLIAKVTHPVLGTIVYFDPTDEVSPFGRLSGGLQSTFAVVVTANGGEPVETPRMPVTSNSVERRAQFSLDARGKLRGDVREVWQGDPAARHRYAQRSVATEHERIAPIESLLGRSLAAFEIEKASIFNFRVPEQPLEWSYVFSAENYAKVAGDLLLVRPRVLGSKSSGLLEQDEPRQYAVEFEGPKRDQDVFEIAIPDGYTVDSLPPAVNADYGFASYKSKTEVVGKVLRYTRTFEIRELSVPLEKTAKLKVLYREIGDDERNLAVLKRL